MKELKKITLPPLQDLLNNAVVLELPMNVKFRRILTRRIVLLEGPHGWGEFSPFLDYSIERSAPWLYSAIETAYSPQREAVRETVEINATIPAIPADTVAKVANKFAGARTAKVKVAEPGQTFADDLERIRAAADLFPKIRIDVNGRWGVNTAYQNLQEISRITKLEYAEQPCASVSELAELKSKLAGEILIAADESIRVAKDPLLVVQRKAADIAILKFAPLGGYDSVIDIAKKIDIPVVISSALDSSVGIDQGLVLAANLVAENRACGLATENLFKDTFAAPKPIIAGKLSTRVRTVETRFLDKFMVGKEIKTEMLEKLVASYEILAK